MVFPSSYTSLPLRSRDSFFHDPYFSDCWEIMERRKKEFEQKCCNSSSTSSDLGTSSNGDLFTTSSSSRKLLDSSTDPITSTLGSRGRSRLNSHFHNYYPTTALIRSNFMDQSDEDFIGRNRGGLLGTSSSGLGIQMDKEKFKISLDVQQFSPEELTVKTVHNTIYIEGKHEEKQDSHGFISRNFQRNYTLPSDVKAEEVECNFTSDGILQITAPRHLEQQQQQQSSTTTSSSNNATAGTSSSTTFPMSLSEKIKQDMQRAREDWDKSASEIFSKHRSDRSSDFERKDHSRLIRMFEPYFSAFPEFDPVPFWKKESPRTTSLIEELSAKDKQSSLLVDEFGRKRTTAQLLEEVNKRKAELLKDSKSSGNASSELQCDRDNFKVMLDVQQFKPEEIGVKTYDYFVVVEAKHEAKEDPHGTITREFKRKYMLPRDVRSQDVVCNLSSDGVLVIMAPRIKPDELESGTRGKFVPIQQSAEATSTTTKTSTSATTNESQKVASGEHLIHIDKEQAAVQPTKSYQNTTTLHEIRTETKPADLASSTATAVTNGTSANEKTITIDKEQSQSNKINIASTSAFGTTNEHVIPITREISLISNGPGVRIDFPESRPESAASTATSTIGNSTTLPFDFTSSERERQGSEPLGPGGAPDLPQDPPAAAAPTTTTTTTAPGERIIKISIGA